MPFCEGNESLCQKAKFYSVEFFVVGFRINKEILLGSSSVLSHHLCEMDKINPLLADVQMDNPYIVEAHNVNHQPVAVHRDNSHLDNVHTDNLQIYSTGILVLPNHKPPKIGDSD